MGSEGREIPMFPLGSVLLPHGLLPLHIFETRYQRLLNHALEADNTFGVVLITRGSEVGGGEGRSTVGTLARIQEHRRFDDGRAAVLAVGTHRLEVLEWLADDPYPRARVADVFDPAEAAGDSELLAKARAALETLLATAVQAGHLDQVPEVEWAADTNEAIWQLAGLAPLGQLDRQAVLAELDPTRRIARLAALIDDICNDLRLLGDLD